MFSFTYIYFKFRRGALCLACVTNASIVSHYRMNNSALLRWWIEGRKTGQDFGNPRARFYFMFWYSTTVLHESRTWKMNVSTDVCKRNEKRIDEDNGRILNAFHQAACHQLRVINFTSRTLAACAFFMTTLNNVKTCRSPSLSLSRTLSIDVEC